MNTKDSRIDQGDSLAQFGSLFQSCVDRARVLIEKGEIDSAIELLAQLEYEYIRGATIFGLLGDALLKRGDIQDGVRYKTLFQVLKGTFEIVGEETARNLRVSLGTYRSEAEAAGPKGTAPLSPESEDQAFGDFVPHTASMGQELLRQGHYQRALQIFDRLVEESPEDESLREARELAVRKMREAKLLHIYRQWLKNIEQIKSGESTLS